MQNNTRPQSRRFPFSKRGIESLPAHDPESRSRETEYTDSECIGLHLRVSKAGRKFFQHRYRHFGRKRCMTLGEFPHVSLQDARQRVSEHKALLARDIDPGDERAQKHNDLTFVDFAEKFYVPHATMHKETWHEDVYKIDRRINPTLGKRLWRWSKTCQDKPDNDRR
ncbi:MAG: Arm DNA-binding domain-containing protein [Geoalkalibacter sp.]|uniref:Arm DNA-binding domain-containing protein n=1 Tax=Geoalkalibacter sp. TaxID=3041440 RepID=UPI003D0DFC7B